MGNLSIMPLVVAIPAFLLIGYTIVDIVRRTDLNGGRKVVWAAAVVVLPVIGTFAYLLARPFQDPAHVTLRGNERTHAVVALIEQRAAGSITQDEFTEKKRAVFDEAVDTHRARYS